MHSAATKCTRCKQKNTRAHDILCEDTYRLHKRIKELSSQAYNPYSNPLISGMVIIALASMAVLAYEYAFHPTGQVAQGIKNLLPNSESVPVIAKKAPGTL